MTRRLAFIATLLVALGTLWAGIAIAASRAPVRSTTVQDAEQETAADASLSGADADRAARAALDAMGGGTVVEVERGDDGVAAFEVEIRRPDGTTAEVRLDRGFGVVDVVAQT